MDLVGFPVSSNVNEFVLKNNKISLIHVKNQGKVKALMNGADVGNKTQGTQMSSA